MSNINIKKITIPNSVKCIEEKNILWISKFLKIVINLKTLAYVGKNVFKNCDLSTDIKQILTKNLNDSTEDKFM